MNHLAIIRALSFLLVILSGLLLIGALVALAYREVPQAIAFLVAGCVSGPLGGTVLLLTDVPRQTTRAIDGLALAVLFWFLIPLFGAIPFFPLTVERGFLIAYYEAVSCLTTTGQTLIPGAAPDWPASLVFWRGLLHMLGAIASITIAATVFSALNLGGPGIHRSRFFTIPETSFFDGVPKVLRASAAILSVTGGLLIALLALSGVPPMQAFTDAISVVTTGLVDPGAAERGPANSIAVVWLSVGLLVGTLGLIILDHVGHQEYLKAIRDPEWLALLGSLAFISGLVFLAGLPYLQGLGWSLSSLSTSGLALSDPARFDRIPLALALLPVLIGGSALSAAGGIKLARLIVLSRRVSLEFMQLGYRGSVQTFSFRGRRQSEKTIMGVWVYLVAYIMATVLGILLLSLAGLPFYDALRATVGSLSNAGHILGGTVSEMPALAQTGLILGMILGRLEVVALIPVLSPTFWRS
jgi:Trk-type K+ transport system membrane component